MVSLWLRRSSKKQIRESTLKYIMTSLKKLKKKTYFKVSRLPMLRLLPPLVVLLLDLSKSKK